MRLEAGVMYQWKLYMDHYFIRYKDMESSLVLFFLGDCYYFYFVNHWFMFVLLILDGLKKQ